jgi:hypothetical protein
MGIIRFDPPPCSACRSLGAYEHDGVRYHLFLCLLRLHSLALADPDWPTLMARFGDGPDDFRRGMGLTGGPAIIEALRRATEQGLYDPKRPLHPGMQPFYDALLDLLRAAVERQLNPVRGNARRPSRR